MVGFRVFDVGLLVVWLVWFFRLRDEGGDPPEDRDDDGRGGGPRLDPGGPGGGGGLGLLLPGTLGSRRRFRDHGRARPPASRTRGGDPLRHPAPARVRRPVRSPVRS